MTYIIAILISGTSYRMTELPHYDSRVECENKVKTLPKAEKYECFLYPQEK